MMAEESEGPTLEVAMAGMGTLCTRAYRAEHCHVENALPACSVAVNVSWKHHLLCSMGILMLLSGRYELFVSKDPKASNYM